MIIYIILKMEDYNPNDFNKKVNEFNTELPGRMYIFAITKFNRKNKDIIDVGTWLLVADRDYSTKKTHCDMLEVYSKSEISKLMEMSNDWSVFTGEEPEKKDYDTMVRTEEVTMDIEFDDI